MEAIVKEIKIIDKIVFILDNAKNKRQKEYAEVILLQIERLKGDYEDIINRFTTSKN